MQRLKRVIITLTLCAASTCAMATTATTVQSNARSLVKIQHWKTANGAQVYFVRSTQLPMLDARLVFAAGSAYDNKHWGIASFTNRLIGEGTQTQTADQIAEAFDNVGASLSVWSGRDMAMVSLRSLSDSQYLTPALQTFTDVIAHPNFPAKAIYRTKNRVLAEIKVGQQKPGTVAKRAFYATIYSGQPYGHEPLGTLKSVAQFTQTDVQNFFQKYYTAENAKLFLVGNISRQQAEQIAQQLTQSLRVGSAPPKLPLATNVTQSQSKHINFPSKQTTIIIGQVGINRQSPDYFPLIVGNNVLGGNPLVSMLFKRVRDQRGLAYYVYSRFYPLALRGPFRIRLQTKARSSQEALQLVQRLVDQFIKNGPSQKALNVAKQNLILGFPQSIATNAGVLGAITNIGFYQRPLDYLDRYRDNIRAVTPAQVRDAFTRLVHPNRMVIITVGPQVGSQPSSQAKHGRAQKPNG